MKPWQATLLGVAVLILQSVVCWLEFYTLQALGLTPMPEPLAFLAVLLFVSQFWLLTRIPGIRRFLARPIIEPDDK